MAKKSSNNCTQGANGNIESMNIDNEPSMTSRTQKKGGDAQNSTKTKKGADNSRTTVKIKNQEIPVHLFLVKLSFLKRLKISC